MCGYESEIILFQLFLYARKRQPNLKFDAEKLQSALSEWGITTMKELFELPSEARFALVIPLLTMNSSIREAA